MLFINIRNLVFISLLTTVGCSMESQEHPAAPDPKPSETTARQPAKETQSTTVNASYYGKGDGLAGKKTASGETFNPKDHTAAHKSYPFGTKLEVTNPDTGKSVTVRVNDRGPYKKGRNLDLSHGAAKSIGMTDDGVQKLKVEVVKDEPVASEKPVSIGK